jgi:class 3 adenylate cyclase/ribosomal protein L40E
MNCASCQAQNSDDAKFCTQCGAATVARCSQCGAPLATGAKFCSSCGHQLGGAEAEPADSRLHQYIPKELLAKLDSARAAGGVQGERRIVTMLFCDVQGSTAAAEKLDPEEWGEIMNGAFEHLIAPVYRYEGTLARLMGDAILAFFGAPISHEDDPQRAVLAGLDIIERSGSYREEVRRTWGVDFNVRVGINTGLVVVGEVGSDLRVEYTAMGDAINLAARMEQTAEPGTLQISDGTHRLVAPLFDIEELGGVQVKGKEEPVQSYRVLRQSALPGPLRGIVGLDSAMVGREDELKALVDGIEALRYGRAQIFSVMGEAGLGKSRLVAEMRHALDAGDALPTNGSVPSGSNDADQRTVGWYEGRSLSFESSTVYAPFSSLLGACFGLRSEQTDEEK